MRFAFTCPRLVANFLYGFWFQVAVLSMSIPSRNNEPQAIKKTCSWCENTSYIMNSPAYTSKVRAMSPDAISVGAELMGYELTFIDGDHTHTTHTHTHFKTFAALHCKCLSFMFTYKPMTPADHDD